MKKRRLLFSGPVLTASGYGVHARQLLNAIVATDRYDVYVESLRWGETPMLYDTQYDWIRTLTERSVDEPEISIQVTIPNEFKRRAPLSIGVTAGIEVDRVSPRWILKCNQEVDLVVVPSEHSRTAFLVEYQTEQARLHLEKPIVVIPEGVDASVYRPRESSFPMELSPKNFVFTGLGLDKANGRDRKNVTQLVEYFCKTFAGNRAVGLILKVSIVNNSTMDFEIVKRRVAEIKQSTGCGQFPDIRIIHGRMSEAELASLYCDPRVVAAVSLTHGEGFGLPLIEAAACGLPVMATDWSGHLDFLTKDGKKLFVPFEYEMAEIPRECVWEGVMEAGTRWASVKESDVSTKLQKMALSSDTPRKWAAELSEHVRSAYSLEVSGKKFTDILVQAADELERVIPKSREDFISENRKRIREKGPSLIYTMPMSAGDVFLSTGVVSALRRKHPGHRVFFATAPQYFGILKDLHATFDEESPLIDELIEWQPWMHDVSILEDVFDEVYTPNLAVQMVHSNWVHRGKGRNLIDEFAVQCGVKADDPVLPQTGAGILAPDKPWVVLHTGGQKSARRYFHWSTVIRNLRDNGVSVAQVGSLDDLSVGAVDMDLRGKTDHGGLVSALTTCHTFLGIDSYPMHVANSMGLRVVALFGSSYAASSGPKYLPVLNHVQQRMLDSGTADREWFDLDKREEDEARRLILLETPNRNGCERACYKDECRIDSENPCINNITAESVFNAVISHVMPNGKVEFRQYRPKIAGYTHIFNPKKHGYPYIQSIESMLAFCDEVVVVDGGSTDGSRLDLELIKLRRGSTDGALRVVTREWDPDEPGMDGMQKAFGRAMVSPNMEFLWQQDADEVVHEDDYEKIVDICRRFPAGCDVVHLPVVELWGDDRHARTDRHSWKWRLTRNNFRITHGIALAARQIDPKTGRVYAKRGLSDGCEVIDIVSGEHLPHRGFYTKELERLRLSNPTDYGRAMNAVYSKLPSVWHYSWANLSRKVRNFRDFWDKQWQVLYQSPPEPRFPDVVTDEDVVREAERLLRQGGEHGPAQTFELELSTPKTMEGWL